MKVEWDYVLPSSFPKIANRQQPIPSNLLTLSHLELKTQYAKHVILFLTTTHFLRHNCK